MFTQLTFLALSVFNSWVIAAFTLVSSICVPVYKEAATEKQT
jgi:hypothetical protein